MLQMVMVENLSMSLTKLEVMDINQLDAADWRTPSLNIKRLGATRIQGRGLPTQEMSGTLPPQGRGHIQKGNLPFAYRVRGPLGDQIHLQRSPLRRLWRPFGRPSTREQDSAPGYYWPTMGKDSKKFARKCDWCQHTVVVTRLPPEQLTSLTAPNPSGTRIGLLPVAKGQTKFTVVAIDYLTK